MHNHPFWYPSKNKIASYYEKSGVIKQYNVVPNENSYPYLHYKILISLRNIDEKKYTKLVEFCRLQPNVVYIVKALGPWDFEMDIEVKNIIEFRQILMQLKTEFSEIIRDYTTLQIYQVHKYNFCPSNPHKE